MPAVDQSSLRNLLLRRLAPDDFARLALHLERVDLGGSEVVSEPHQPFTHAIFPESGIVCVVAVSPKGQVVESGLIGRDGFAPMSLALDVDRSPQRMIVQVPGQGHRIAAGPLREALAASPALHRLLLRFAHTLAMQSSHTALTNAVHPMAERLARWLLMCHDRVEGDGLALTHKLLGVMLAVRRPTVTTTLNMLEDQGLIRIGRGRLTVTDRRGLEAFAGDAYGQPEAEYERLIASLP